MSEQFSILIDSRTRFETGEPGGVWLSMPTTKEQLHKAMQRVGITAENPQDFFINGFANTEQQPFDVPLPVIQSAGLDELNYLGNLLSMQRDEDRDKFTAAVTLGEHAGSIKDLINLAQNLDCYWLYPTVQNEEDYGYYLIDELDELELPEEAKKYFMYEDYGRDAAINDGGRFTEQGYIYNNKNTFTEWYDGREVPEEYKITPLLQQPETPTQPDPEKMDMDAISTRQAATLTAEPPQPRPVVPIVLSSEKPAEKMKEITGRLEQGIQEIFESERYKEYLRVMSKFHDYSVNNTLLIAMQKPDASLVAGFSAWKSKFERNVRKGEKGIKIIAPSPFKVKQEMEKIDPDTQKPIVGRDGKPITEEREITIPAYKVVSVFDVSQTEGKEIPDISAENLVADVEQYEDFFKALEKTSPVPIAFEQIEGGANGYYHLEDKRIAIDEGISELQTLKTAIHEIAHARLHDVDLNAPKDEQNRVDRRTREVQAESVAYAVCQHFGLDTSEYSFAYVAGWSSGKEMSELKASLETIQAEAKELITEIEGHFTELQQQRGEVEQQREAAESSVFVKLPQEKQAELSGTVKDTLQTLIDADKRVYGDVTGKTLEAIATQGFTYQNGQLEKQPEGIHAFVEKSLNNAGIAFTRFQSAEQFQAWIEAHADPQKQQPQPETIPDNLTTGEQIKTPRGSFRVADMSREQMEAAGYGFHHQSDDGKYLIMANGMRAFAIAAGQPEKVNPLKHIEDTIEQNDNSFDGLINNTPQTPSVSELEQRAKAGEAISVTDLAKAVKAEKREQPQKKPSILKKLDEYKKQAKAQPQKQQVKEKQQNMEV